MGNLVIPRLRYIKRRYYWQPTPATKALGFKAEALGPDLAKAVERAQLLNDLVEAERGSMASPSRPKGSVAELIALFDASARFKALTDNTRRDYHNIMRRIEKVAGRHPVAAIDRKGLVETYEKLEKRHGLAMANGIMRVWRVLLGFAWDRGWRQDNPARGLRLTGVAARDRVWTPEQVQSFCAAASAAGRPSMGLAVRLALGTAQREGDVLHLSWRDWDGKAFALTQGKTGTPLRVPVGKALAAELNSMPRSAVQVITSEATGRPYRGDHFRHEFARIRALAGLPKDLRFQDLRWTAATELGAAGATDDEIRAITGHKSRGVVAVYVRPDDRMARAAARKRDRHKTGPSVNLRESQV